MTEPAPTSNKPVADSRGPDRITTSAPTPGEVVGFAAAMSADLRPPQQSQRRRLGYLGLDIVNRLMPKTPNRVVLHSTIDLEDGVFAVAEELHARGWTATILLERPGRAAEVHKQTGGMVSTLPKRSLRGLLQFLTARFVMTTHNIYGNRQPPESQIVVNLWHGDPPAAKVIGQLEPGQGPVRATYAPVPSRLARAFRSAEFGMHPLRIPVVGAPRNDRMLRSDGAAVRRLLGEDPGCPLFLWLPSFRTMSLEGRVRQDVAQSHPGVPFPSIDVEKLDDWLVGHNARVVLKLHPLDVATFSGSYRAIRVLTQEEMQEHGLTVNTMVPGFDALLTDVSSIWVDYLLLDKPLIFAFPDVQAYREGRGLSIEPYEDWVPGPFVRDIDGLIAALTDLVEGRDPMAAERAIARVRFHEHLDDRSAARLLDGLGIHPR